MKKLVIAEKPSVAKDLARVLGRVPKKEDHYENDEWVIDCAVGHLVELFMPDDFDKKLKAWKLTNLPIIPPEFQLKPIANTKKKFQQLKKQLKRKDVGEVINACDAGREGELIFTYIYELAKAKKPIKRLWMLSMTDQAIKDAFANMREGVELQPLQDAARCRSESDWLIGINGTRAVTLKRSRSMSRQVSTVGRVQTPTLSLVIKREKEINSFVPRDFFRITSTFELTNGTYQGVFQRKDFKKAENDKHDRIDRMWKKEEAEEIYSAIQQAKQADISETKKRSPQSPGRLYDLTTLQREANRLHSYPASRTLQIAQSLYERHKVITYPRTDSKALPEDYGPIGIYLDPFRENSVLMPKKHFSPIGWMKKIRKFSITNKSAITSLSFLPLVRPRTWTQMKGKSTTLLPSVLFLFSTRPPNGMSPHGSVR